MFQFQINSQDLANALKKISIAIPPASAKGENDAIKIALYKKAQKINKSFALFLAFDGKIQAISSLEILNVSSDVDEREVHVNGKKMEAAAYAFAGLNTMLEITIDQDVKIVGAGNQVTLPICQSIVALKQNEPLLQEIEMETSEFTNFINFGASCYGDERGSRGLHCIGLRVDVLNKKMIATSSNGTKCSYAETSNLSFKQLKTEENGSGSSDVHTIVVEGRQIRNAVKNLSRKKVSIGIDSKKLRIKCGTDVVMILTQDISFPMDALLQVRNKFEKKGMWKVPLQKLFQALAIYEVTMENSWVKIVKKGDAQISIQGKDEQNIATVVCAQDGDIDSIALDEREWKSALSVFDKEKDIVIETSTATMPILIRQHEDDKNLIIVMPVAQ